ncbi:TPA: hypothetical protein ACNCVR_001428 [Escherichia coli]|nr:hypothetical protein [Escherichia coli]EHW5262663.1 hypothetical protein [Escherichia coli]EJN6680531.1 hypothetical protein [Escherichia coli]
MSRYKTGHKQPRFRYSVLARCVAWANISVQVLFPLAVTFTPVMAARAQHAVQPRLSMGNTTVVTVTITAVDADTAKDEEAMK